MSIRVSKFAMKTAKKAAARKRIHGNTWKMHTLIMLAKADIKPQEVLDELARREGLSGIAEKESRSK